MGRHPKDPKHMRQQNGTVKASVRLPSALNRRIKIMAAREGVSLMEIVRRMVEAQLKVKEQ